MSAMGVRLVFFLYVLKFAVSEYPSLRVYYGESFLEFSSKMRSENVFLESIFANLYALENSSELCSRQLMIYRNSLRNNTSWAIHYLDSSGYTLGPGWLTGNTVNLGNFDECVSQVAEDFRGKYCWLKIELLEERPHSLPYVPNNNPIIFSLCVPGSCGEEDLKILTNAIANRGNFSVKPICQSARPSMTTADIVAICFFALVGLFTISSLLPKEWIPIDNNLFQDIWSCFDLRKNLKTLSPNSRNGNILASLYGIRFFSQSSLVWYHLIIITLIGYNPVKNKFIFNKLYRSWDGALETELVLAVDTFFMMSGVLLTYNCLKKKMELSLLKYYFHRYLRLTPPLMAAVIFVSTFCNKLCDGPLCLVEMDKEKKICESYWWTNFLYINNYYPGLMKSCLPHTWYLAADWQLFMFVSPFVVALINKKPEHIYKLIGAIHLSSLIYSLVTSIIYELPPESLLYKSTDESIKYFNTFYATPFVRAGPWSVGMFLGVFLHDYKKKPIQFTKRSIFLGWSVWGVFLGSSVFLDVPFLQEGSDPGVWAISAFLTFQRNVFALAMGWIVFACATNTAGPLGTFLSSPIFEPLGKLTYSMYLIHKSIISLYAGDTRSTSYYSTTSQLPSILGLIVISTGAALLLYLTFEAPYIHIEKLIFRKGNSSHTSPPVQPMTTTNHEEHQTISTLHLT